MKQGSNDIPIACIRVDSIFSPETRARHQHLWHKLGTAVQGLDELPHGYALRFPLDDELFTGLAEFITYERHCCPFLHFSLAMQPDPDHISLQLTGRPGVKDFLRGELSSLIPAGGDGGR